MDLPRSFGILLHPTSFPGRWGIGGLGKEALQFTEWLARAGGQWWQVLPLGPTSYGDSPYQAFSAFAGNPYLIDPDWLMEQGWLAVAEPPHFDPRRVDYGWIYQTRWPQLHQAYQGFLAQAGPQWRALFEEFLSEEAFWLNDYALFMALKNLYGGKPWNLWPDDLRLRQPEALEAAREKLAYEVGFHAWTQWAFYYAWARLRKHARELGIGIIGDMPIFVAYDSADVWAHPDYFHLNDDGSPSQVAGVPPDYFSETGQLWGNPLYNWPAMQADGFSWWIERIQQSLKTADLVRIDHFRGFEAYWSIPGDATTAVEGEWIKAPGEALFHAVRQALGAAPIIAEDLGLITPEVEALRDDSGFPGMKILQFAFSQPTDPFLPHTYAAHGRMIVYPGTHDNDTTLGWYLSVPQAEKDLMHRYLAQQGIRALNPAEVPGALAELGFSSRARLVVLTLQDVLGLGTEARMNFPGRPEGNWSWRYLENQLTPDHAEGLYRLAQNTRRHIAR